MRFGLRRQLFAIGLVTLALPVASALYIRETERALRDAQAAFLSDLGRGLVPLLTRPAALSPPGSADEALYAHALSATPVLDGFSDDWRLSVEPSPAVVGGDDLRTLAGERDGTLWLAAQARHGDGDTPRFDVACGRGGDGLAFVDLEPSAPGPVQATTTAAEFAGRIRGVWQPVDGGSRIEIRLPAGLCVERTGVVARIGDAEDRTYRGRVPGALARIEPDLGAALAGNAIPGVESFVVDRFGFRITPVTGTRQRARPARSDGRLARLFSGLPGGAGDSPLFQPAAYQHGDDVVTAALRGQSSTARRSDPAGGTLLVAARPLGAGALVMVANAEAILTLADPSLQRLTLVIVVTTIAIVTLLLAYASWLSWRVRRLARDTTAAVDARGRIRTAPRGTGARDEIGELARSLQTMLERTAEQQRWLAAMADTLSHELRTPLAIVQSSLENLEQAALDARQRRLTARASDGVTRLRAILNAVSGANRAEQAARDGETAAVALAPLLRQLRDAYADTFPTHRFVVDAGADPVVTGTAELIVQAIDKLVENAVRFAPEGSTIRLELDTDDDGVRIAVRNPGPPLPAGDPSRLFDSFVSETGHDAAGTTHLGFGLYIARLIVEAHGGRAQAADWREAGTSGVVVTLRFPESAG